MITDKRHIKAAKIVRRLLKISRDKATPQKAELFFRNYVRAQRVLLKHQSPFKHQ